MGLGGRQLRRRQAHRPRASPEHRVRGGEVPEHRRMLERGHRDDHADGRGVHARVPILRGGHRQSARLAGCRRTGERRALGRADGLKYVVLTSVNRDDLPDGGAAHYAAAIRAIKRAIPDRGRGADAGFPGRACATCKPCSIRARCVRAERRDGRRLTHPVRDARAGYEQTARRAALRARLTGRGADQDQPDAGSRRDRCGNSQTMADMRAAGVDL
jgi:hypothetical protein